MNIKAYKEFLLSNIPTASLASGGKVINCRCFECPDSANPKSKHFYISIPQNDTDPSLYYCHKCHCSGVVNHNKLLEWNIFNQDIALDIINHNKNCINNPRNNKYYNRTIYKINNYYTSEDDISKYKLNYINDRLGTSLSFQDLRDLKIVLNLNDLLKSNHITNLTRNENIVSQIDSNFLGFLSIDNAFLNMRRICPEGKVYKSIDKRYINYKIFDKFDTSERFYTIPTRIDLNIPERIKVNIAEGPFDILSIYENVRVREPGVYTSIAGSNYLGIGLYFIDLLKTPYIELHYYPDNDKYGSIDRMKYIKRITDPIGIPFYVHRNMYNGEKDFGTKNIIESIMQL